MKEILYTLNLISRNDLAKALYIIEELKKDNDRLQKENAILRICLGNNSKIIKV